MTTAIATEVDDRTLAGAVTSLSSGTAISTRGATFKLGSQVKCGDAVCGRLVCLVIDPAEGRVTHLSVDPGKGHVRRLVPIEVASVASVASVAAVMLTCSLLEFDAFEPAQEIQFVPPALLPTLGYAPEGTYEGPMAALLSGSFPDAPRDAKTPVAVVYDKVPPDKVEVGSGDAIYAIDGNVGKIEGVVIDPVSYDVTHLCLQEGHLWTRRSVVVPMSAVDSLNGAINISLCKQEVKRLPRAFAKAA